MNIIEISRLFSLFDIKMIIDYNSYNRIIIFVLIIYAI